MVGDVVGLTPRPGGQRALRVEVDREHLAAVVGEAAPRLMVVVVLPTPPFWLQSAMMRAGPWPLERRRDGEGAQRATGGAEPLGEGCVVHAGKGLGLVVARHLRVPRPYCRPPGSVPQSTDATPISRGAPPRGDPASTAPCLPHRCENRPMRRERTIFAALGEPGASAQRASRSVIGVAAASFADSGGSPNPFSIVRSSE